MSISPIITFKAGVCDLDSSTTPPTVKPKPTPGYIYLYSEDDLVHFCWRPRSASLDEPELDLVMVPSDGSFTPYKPSDASTPSNPEKPTNGRVLILLAGRFRGKRVVLLKHLSQGVLLVTGPFKINGVPLRRVNARYVIATSAKVDLKGVDSKTLEKVSETDYFTKDKKAEKEQKGEEAFFKHGEKPEKKKVASARASDQKAIDQSLLASIKKEQFLGSYLATSFSLRNGDKPHEMKW